MIESQEAERRAQIVDQFMEQGKAAVQAGKKAQARYYFQAALEAVPDHPDALLWLAFLAGGGQPSLVYLARLLDADPTNQRARQAIRWARKRAQPRTDQLAVSPVHKPVWNRRRLGTLAGLVAWMIIVLGGVFTAAFALDLPLATPTWAQSIAVLATATPLPSDTPSPTPTATPTDFPSPTASPLPSNTPTATPTSTPTATPTPIPPTSTPLPTATAVPTAFPTAPVGDTFRWIDVDLTHQRLVAYEGDTPVRTVAVSTGASRTPTVTGRFKIYAKYKKANMSGPGYNLPNVPYVMYFNGGYGLHGTYWHTNFGQPMSHGCVNLPTPDAEWLYNWASVGTPVVVHY